jgi:hypothetical protein
MKNTLILLLFIFILSAVLQWLLPYWWLSAVVAFGVCVTRANNGGQAFLAGFLGVGLLWFAMALIIHVRSNGLLTSKMDELLRPIANGISLVLLSAIVGGLVAGLAGLSGFLLRRATRLHTRK